VICIVGARGSIGRRYQAVCRHLGIPFQIYDIKEKYEHVDISGATHFIVCTPTDSHIQVLNDLQIYGKPILCEKPITKNLNLPEVQHLNNLENVYTVCNYLYLARQYREPSRFLVSIEYDFFHSGQDGLFWDCCQLIYLDPMCELKNKSPFWTLKINGRDILYRQVEQSYVSMVHDFYKGNHGRLWTLQEGIEMTKEVINYESRHTYSSKI